MSCAAAYAALAVQLPPTPKSVLLVLALRQNAATGALFPTINRIALDTGMSKSSVLRGLAELERAGIVAKTKARNASGKQIPNHYRLNIPGMDAGASDGRQIDTRQPEPGATMTSSRASNPVEAGLHTDTQIRKMNKKDELLKPPRTKPSAPAPSCPQDVPEQIWTDWLHLLRAKRTPATSTLIAAARTEADNAGMQFADYLAQWCLLGWPPKPSTNRERSPKPEPAWRTEQRNRVLQAVPGIAARSTAGAGFTIEADLCTGSPTRADLPFDPAA